MAAGDVYAGVQDIAANAAFEIRPGVGQEGVIHNLYYVVNGITPIRFLISNGSLSFVWAAQSGSGAMTFLTTHVTHDYWIRIENDDLTSDAAIAWDGIYTK